MPERVEVTDEFLASRGHTRESYEALSRGGQWSVRNREKHREYTDRWAARNYDKKNRTLRKAHLKRMYGITLEDYDRMFEEQQGRCAICGTDDPHPDREGWNNFVVDHCHETDRVRGLLCNPCNRGIGLLSDNADRLRKAANYLEKA